MTSGNIQPNRQSGLSTFATIGAFVGLGTVLLVLFFVAGSGIKKPTNTPAAQNSTTNTSPTPAQPSTSKEPPFIRIPENSSIYNNSLYTFMFAYPSDFGTLTDASSSVGGTVIFAAESAAAAQKPVGSGAAVMNGKFGAYVYKKSDFKVVIKLPDIAVAPTKTGNDTTWKVVSLGTGSQGVSIGDSYQVKTVKSQTGITVYDFALADTNTMLGRWVFESGDNYVLIAMPTVSKPDGTALSTADLAAYKVIGSNIARTVRIPTNSTSTNTTTNSSATPTTSTTPTTTTSGN